MYLTEQSLIKDIVGVSLTDTLSEFKRSIMTFSEFKEEYGIQLTNQQEQAVLKTDGYTLLLAVPGSGKTTVIVSRLGYMMKCLGIPHDNILTLTYSVAACKDMKARYISVFGNEEVPQFRTIHGICTLIIMEYERRLERTSFELVGEEDSENRILSELYPRVYGRYPELGVINELKRDITYVRNMMMSEEEINVYSHDTKLYEILTLYKHEKIRRSIMDYDDQLEFAYKILHKYPSILESFKKRYKYINVDEAQDTSKLQHEIIRMLAGNNLFMVGDEDQSIYGFRAAYPAALLEFERNYPKAQILFMERNFRSTGNIIKRAKTLIENNSERRSKNMYTEKEDGKDIEIVELPQYNDQFRYIYKVCDKAENAKETTAILFRNNDSAIPIIDILERAGIRYRCRETDGMFFTNPGVCDILSVLKLCFEIDNAEVFLDIAPRLGCGMTKEEALLVIRCAKEKNMPVMEYFLKYLEADSDRAFRTASFIRALKDSSVKKLSETIRELHSETCFGRFLDFRMRDKTKIAILSRIAERCDGYYDFCDRLDFLKNEITKAMTPDIPCVVLSTIHSSKGLEFDNVVLIDIKDGILPGGTDSEMNEKQKKAYLEEERRLFYVAVTRAKKSVKILKYHSEYDGSRVTDSQFLRELMRYDTSITDVFRKSHRNVDKIMTRKTEAQNMSLFIVGTDVIHRAFGKGKIVDISCDTCRIVFENGDERTFSLKQSVISGFLQTIK